MHVSTINVWKKQPGVREVFLENKISVYTGTIVKEENKSLECTNVYKNATKRKASAQIQSFQNILKASSSL